MTIPAGDFIALDQSYDDLSLTTHVKQIKVNKVDLKCPVNLMR